MDVRVFLEEADRPPFGYLNRHHELPVKTPDPQEWVKAPEFVPRVRASNIQSEPLSIPYTPYFGVFPPSSQMPPTFPIQGIPAGYSANYTSINTGDGPPIPAILLRKKRKRRTKLNTNSMIVNGHASSPGSSHPSDPNGFGSDEEEHFQPPVTNKGSCPDLSKDQLDAWDDYLFQTAQEHNDWEDNNNLRKQVYEPHNDSMARESLDGHSNQDIRRLDEQLGGPMTTSQVLKKLSNYSLGESDSRVEKTLATELDQLNFRPTINRYGYPQIDSNRVHVTTSDGYGGSIRDVVVDTNILRSFGDEENYVEDYIDGLNITVNQFDDCDDLTLSDVETAQPTRFHHIQRAIKSNVQVYTDLKAPDRVCCLIM